MVQEEGASFGANTFAAPAVAKTWCWWWEKVGVTIVVVVIIVEE